MRGLISWHIKCPLLPWRKWKQAQNKKPQCPSCSSNLPIPGVATLRSTLTSVKYIHFKGGRKFLLHSSKVNSRTYCILFWQLMHLCIDENYGNVDNHFINLRSQMFQLLELFSTANLARCKRVSDRKNEVIFSTAM